MTRGTAIVTGAGRVEGLGFASARKLAATHSALALVDVNLETVTHSAEILRREVDVPILAVGCDLRSGDNVAEAAARIEAELPPVQTLVNNAGITAPTRFLDITVEEWDRIFSVNIRSMFLMTQRVLPTILREGAGRIVCMSSTAAQRGGGTFGTVHYSSSKAAVLGFVKCLARELGATGTTVNAVAPGVIGTGITGGRDADRAKIIETIPMMRDGTAAEVAAVVAFLCDDAASYVSGACFDVNGGFHIH